MNLLIVVRSQALPVYRDTNLLEIETYSLSDYLTSLNVFNDFAGDNAKSVVTRHPSIS